MFFGKARYAVKKEGKIGSYAYHTRFSPCYCIQFKVRVLTNVIPRMYSSNITSLVKSIPHEDLVD